LSAAVNTIKWILDHPRHCFVHLFPWRQTLWLLLVVISFTLTEFVFFMWLDWKSEALDGTKSSFPLLSPYICAREE
jgi:Trk-type K+ transport system membrane component